MQFGDFITIITIEGMVLLIYYIYKSIVTAREYDVDFLYESSKSVILEEYLRRRFPTNVSDKVVPFPDTTTIPARIDMIQNVMPLTSYELKCRDTHIKNFMMEKYGNLSNFRAEIYDTFAPADSEESDTRLESILESKHQESKPQESVYQSSDSSSSSKYHSNDGSRSKQPEPVRQPESPKRSEPTKQSESPKKKDASKSSSSKSSEVSNNIDVKLSLKDSESGESSESEVRKYSKSNDFADDDYIAKLIKTNAKNRKLAKK